jgi:hypothetical protein
MVILTAIIHQEYILMLEGQQMQPAGQVQVVNDHHHHQQQQQQQQVLQGLEQGQHLQQGPVQSKDGRAQNRQMSADMVLNTLWDPVARAAWHPTFTAQRLGSITLADVRAAVARRDALISLAQVGGAV